MSTQLISIYDIRSDDRMRKDDGDLTSLCETMHEKGLLQAIGVQPVNNGIYRLLWGHRRLQAAIRLGWTLIEAKVAGDLLDYEAGEIEFLENWERKSMTWQEEALGLLRIHNHRVRLGALASELWGQRETGRLLGISLGNVNYTLTVARLLASGDPEVAACPNMSEALRLLLRRKEAEIPPGRSAPPSETFFKKEDLDRLNQAPEAPGPGPSNTSYLLHRIFDNENFDIEGAGILGLAEPGYVHAAWILDRNEEHYTDLFKIPLVLLRGGIVFKDLSAQEGSPFLQDSLIHFQFYWNPETTFQVKHVSPYFADSTTLEKVLHGPFALSERFWQWLFLENLKDSFRCLYFNNPKSIDALTFCLRHQYRVFSTLPDAQLVEVEKEMKKYGSFNIIDTGL